MHPYYSPSSQLLGQEGSVWVGLISMAMYLLFWTAVVLLGMKMGNKYLARLEAAGKKEDSAVAILRERYARGEIDLPRFREMMENLKRVT